MTGLLVALAGCSTPREAQTPAPAAGTAAPVSHILPAAGATTHRYTAASYAAAADSVAMLPADLATRWQASNLPEHALSLIVAEVGQDPLIAIHPETPRNPASTMKLVTTYAALEELGPGHTWRTELVTAPNALPRPDGTLPGPLYVRASGDPQLKTEDMWRMLHELRLRGVRTLPGIVVDRSVFGNVAIHPGAFDNSPDRVYNASPDALVIGYGAVRLLHVPDAARGAWNIITDPPLAGVRIDNQVRASRGACSGAPAVRTQQDAGATGVTIRVSGTVALSCGEFSLHRLALSQPEHAAGVMVQMWSTLGGSLLGPVTSGPAPVDGVALVSHESPPLSELIRTVNKASNNVMARMMLLALATENGTPGTAQSGASALSQALARQGLVFPELVIENGSGLSRHEQISAGSMASMLNTAWLSPRMPEFVSSLAIAGEDGTVRRRWRNGGATGMAHLKTGTLRDVSALAGYVQGASGKRYVLVSLINDPKAYNSRAFNDAVVKWLSER